MTRVTPLIISDHAPSRRPPARLVLTPERFARLIALAALLFGCWAAWAYHRAGLTLSHYDAKAHLVVARRVVDSITPGWRQIGAVWLPLPHLLDLLPVQVDAFYRTGASAVAMSVVAFGLAVYATARLILYLTGSRVGAVAGAAVLALNPDVLYLQATPMTEALLFGLTLLAIALLTEWVDGRQPTGAVGVTLAAACLTRYEAWPVTVAALALATLARWRRGETPGRAVGQGMRLGLYPGLAGLAFLAQSRLTVGQWFVTGGFWVPDNQDTGHPLNAVASIWWGTGMITGYGVLLLGAAGAAATLAIALASRSRAAALVPLALAASGALPWYAFVLGHPFRIRYMVALAPSVAIGAGIGAGLVRRWSLPAAALVLAAVAIETRPIDFRAPMVVEAQLDSANGVGRRVVTAYLSRHYDGEKIMASMASLAHYMQELSSARFAIRDFVHEGNGDIWLAALERPRAHVGWILVEERAEGGDRLANLTREDPRVLAGFTRVAEGGGVALYRRNGQPAVPGP
jgi:hypothetical protein